MIEIQYRVRACDVCGSNDLEEIDTSQTKARTRSGICIWRIRNVVCRRCGFAFVSPAPTEQSLNAYYVDSFPFWRGEAAEFSIDARIAVLRSHLGNRQPGAFVEIGPNAWEGFREALLPFIGRYIGVEPNSSVDAFNSTFDLAPESVDVVAAYWVLEHVADPGALFSEIARILMPDGLAFIEVPNLLSYPENPAGIVHFEHLTHFSPASLAALAARQGLGMIEASNESCSRPYGFVAVFRKTGMRSAFTLDEYDVARRCAVAGARAKGSYWRGLAEARRKIEAAAADGARIVFWAASKPCADLLDGFEPPSSAIFVDSDPDKKEYLSPLPVVVPSNATDVIERAGFFVICSEQHSNEILASISKMRRAPLAAREYIVLSPGFTIGRGPSRSQRL
jgi:SAM-dependent methyltransferase